VDVALMPGETYGAPGHVRLSYAVSVPRLQEGIGRLGEALATLRR